MPEADSPRPVDAVQGDIVEVDDALAEAWRMLMELVLEQRWRWSEVSAELDVSPAGLRALLAVDPDHPRPMRDLARALNCDPSYCTTVVDDLERAGLARRRAGSTDRRVKTVALTAAGKRALHRVHRDLFVPPIQLSRLTAQERRELARLLDAALREPPTPETE